MTVHYIGNLRFAVPKEQLGSWSILTTREGLGGGGPSKYVAEPPEGNQVNFILQNQNHPTPPLLPLPKEGLSKFSVRVLFYCSVYLPLL